MLFSPRQRLRPPRRHKSLSMIGRCPYSGSSHPGPGPDVKDKAPTSVEHKSRGLVDIITTLFFRIALPFVQLDFELASLSGPHAR